MTDTLDNTETLPDTGTIVAPASQSSDPERSIPTRRVSFAESLSSLPRHFAADGDLINSHLVASMSAVFPDGEDFFVRSVRRYRDQITDPALKRQVNGFIGQEAMHGREHREFNARLAELGYPTRIFERITKTILAIRERLMPPIANLAATAALEHFTATLAEMTLNDALTRTEFGAEGVEHLMLWHALEESEHKAVAFDVYRAVGGSERTRVMTMKVTRFGFVFGMGLQLAASLLTDRTTYRRGELRASWKRFRASNIVSDSVWAQLCEYDRPDFHPSDRDTTALEQHWRAELFGPEGRLSAATGSGR